MSPGLIGIQRILAVVRVFGVWATQVQGASRLEQLKERANNTRIIADVLQNLRTNDLVESFPPKAAALIQIQLLKAQVF